MANFLKISLNKFYKVGLHMHLTKWRVCGSIVHMENAMEKILCGKRNKGKYIIIYDDYATIDICNNLVALIDLDDVDKCKDYNWFLCNGYASTNIKINNKQKSMLLHRFIMNTPGDKDTDHINHNILDNRKLNLRICNHSENIMNTISKTGYSKFKGVCWHKNRNKWVSVIRKDNKLINIGSFDKEEDAALAYNEKAIELFDKFACLNAI